MISTWEHFMESFHLKAKWIVQMHMQYIYIPARRLYLQYMVMLYYYSHPYKLLKGEEKKGKRGSMRMRDSDKGESRKAPKKGRKMLLHKKKDEEMLQSQTKEMDNSSTIFRLLQRLTRRSFEAHQQLQDQVKIMKKG